MSDLAGYKLWLTNLQRQPAFMNNYWSALLANEMKGNVDSFRIPYFIVEEELQKEDENYNLDNKDESIVSTVLRHWLVHLLKEYYDDVSIHNYEEHLREFLESENVLPPNIAVPLIPSISFHNLPTDCKFWILYTLKTHKKGQVNQKPLTKDPLGNTYHLVPDCRLYVRITKPENAILPIGEEKLKGQPWEPLYRFIHNHPCKLLCENKEWEETSKTIRSLKMTNLYYSLHSVMTVQMCGMSAVMMARDGQKKEFEERLLSISPIPAPRTSSVNPKKKRTRVADALVKPADVTVAESGVNPVQDQDELHVNMPPTSHTEDVTEEQLATSLITPDQKTTKTITSMKMKKKKCRDFPGCVKQNCPFEHPKVDCTDLPNCPRGWQCTFFHGFCENDGYCRDIDCPMEHIKSPKTYYRRKREAEKNTHPIESESPSLRKESNHDVKTVENATKRVATATKPPITKKLRCQYFPQCKNDDTDCPYVHPFKPCRKLIAGEKCPGLWCLYKHGICVNDGTCMDLKCIYEHKKSPPVCVRKRVLKEKEGSLPNETASNVSTCSGEDLADIVESVDLNDDSDSSSADTMYSVKSKLSEHDQTNTQGRCKYGANCKSKDCKFEHVLDKCKQFPNCPHGGNCKFVHDICKEDGNCTREDCDYKHILHREISNKWCKFGSRCTKLGCKFIHKECIGICPSPGSCLLRHRPTPAPLPYGFPPGYTGGFGPMPPHPPPPGVRYGHGPDFAYRPAPSPGPYMDPRMGPGFPPGHFPPGGYDPRYPPAPGGFGQVLNCGPGYPSGPGYQQRSSHAPPQPVRSKTPGPLQARSKTPGPQPARSKTPGPQPFRPRTPGFNCPTPPNLDASQLEWD